MFCHKVTYFEPHISYLTYKLTSSTSMRRSAGGRSQTSLWTGLLSNKWGDQQLVPCFQQCRTCQTKFYHLHNMLGYQCSYRKLSMAENKTAIISVLAMELSQCNVRVIPWWRHQMETFSVLLAICVGNSPVTGEFPSQWPVTRSEVFFDLCLNKRLSKQLWDWWFEKPSCPLWRQWSL